MVDNGHPGLSITRQCGLLGLGRSTYYYRPTGESDFNLELMRLMDEVFLEAPFFGSRQMKRHLVNLGYKVGRRRVRRLMRTMGLTAVYQKPRTTRPHPEHKVYPYLLRNVAITRPGNPPGPGVVRGHHLRAHEARLPVSGGHHGLAQPGCIVVAVVQHHGRRLLRGGPGRRPGPLRRAGHLQHRPGLAVHQLRIHPHPA